MTIFAERVKTLRKEHKLSQKQLGEIIGISKCGIWEIEQGENKTNLDRIMILADYFNVSIDYLVGRTDNPDINK